MQKYTKEFREYAINLYTSDLSLSQKDLARKINIPFPTVQSWLRSKTNGLTPFQREIRNRNKKIKNDWQNANDKIKKIRDGRNNLADNYGVTKSTLRQIVYRKSGQIAKI